MVNMDKKGSPLVPQSSFTPTKKEYKVGTEEGYRLPGILSESQKFNARNEAESQRSRSSANQDP
jgi:hypothetical protein